MVAAARVRRLADPKLAGLPPEKRAVLDQIRALGVDEVDLFQGSHVLIRDGGSHWSAWQAVSRERGASSHYVGSPHKQYELELPGLGAVGLRWVHHRRSAPILVQRASVSA